jgi:hypothetical protein
VIEEILERSRRTRAGSVDTRELATKRTPSEQVMAMIVGKGEGSGDRFIDDLKGFKCFVSDFSDRSRCHGSQKSHRLDHPRKVIICQMESSFESDQCGGP